MRFAVVGLGAVGASALYHLARQGYEVVGYEQFEIGHMRGSSHGASRIYRLTYPDPTYTHMMREALPLWEALQAEAGETLIVPCGILWIGSESDTELLTLRNALQSVGVAYEWLDSREVSTRFPAFRLLASERALWQSEGGFLRADACVRACVQIAQHYGASVYENTACVGWSSERGGVRLEFHTGQSERFDGVIFALGGWLPQRVPSLASTLTVTRQTYAYFGIREAFADFAPEHHPVWIEASSHFYGFPSDGQLPGVKIAHHQLGERHNSDLPARPVDESDLAPLRATVARRFPNLTAEVLSAHTCLYTNTPDERFLIQPLAGEPRLWYVSACSGHGFKFAILNGRRVAEAIVRTVAQAD